MTPVTVEVGSRAVHAYGKHPRRGLTRPNDRDRQFIS